MVKNILLITRNIHFFSEAPIKEIAALKPDREGNLHWPDLDVDIEAEALKNPEKYTLLYH